MFDAIPFRAPNAPASNRIWLGMHAYSWLGFFSHAASVGIKLDDAENLDSVPLLSQPRLRHNSDFILFIFH